MLEEMDAEFGIGGLIEKEFGTKKKVKSNEYICAMQAYQSQVLCQG
jgi:hypothetical protein